MRESETALSLDRITKRFGRLAANDDISLTLKQGEVVALLGENGAGKTTLMNILFGHYLADSGEVRVFGKVLPPGKPQAAIKAGIGMVHQHFALAENLTVLDNIMAGTEPMSRLWSHRGAARAKLGALAERFGLGVDLAARTGDLSVGERQRVEILKALYRDARILILDEPTAVLTFQEAERLFETLRTMAAQGLSLIFISHKLHEVLGAANRVIVLRGGKAVAERLASGTNRNELAELMVGRRIARPVRETQIPGPVVMRAVSACISSGRTTRLANASFELRAGETLGIVGVAGNGQTALFELASGLAAVSSGSFELLGKSITQPAPRDFTAQGVGRVPEDRHRSGTVGDMTMWENAILERVRPGGFSKAGFLRRGKAQSYAQALISRFDIRGGAPDTPVRLLSGGNMQKLILGRNLERSPTILVLCQPTRGLDEGAVAAIHTEILAVRRAGAAIMLISEDLDEVIALADRIQAIVNGTLSPPVAAADADPRRLGLMMAGDWDIAA